MDSNFAKFQTSDSNGRTSAGNSFAQIASALVQPISASIASGAGRSDNDASLHANQEASADEATAQATSGAVQAVMSIAISLMMMLL